MGFIKAETQPAYQPVPTGQASSSHSDHFAFLPFAPPSMDGLQPAELCKQGLGSDGRSKVARACTECKSRKMRCDGGLPFCGRCITHSRTKSCAYVDPPKRSPITRQYVSSLETQLEEANRRIAEMEAKTSSEATASGASGPSSASNGDKVAGSTATDAASAADGEDAAADSLATSSSNPALSPPASTSTRSRAWTIGQGIGAAERDSLNSKKRTRTHGGSSGAANEVGSSNATATVAGMGSPSSSRSLDVPQRPSLQAQRQFTSLRNIYPPPKSLVERSDDATLGAGTFIGLSTATAVLRVISQLCKAAQTAPSVAGRPRNFDVTTTGESDDGASEHRSQHQREDSPELTCETLVRVDGGPLDDGHPSTIERYSAHLLPMDTDPAMWSESHRHAADGLLDAYFELHHPAYPILHAATFKGQLRGELPRPSAGTWPMLLNMVFALGSFESRLSADAPELDLHYYGLARKAYNSAIFTEPSVVTVQALALMANYCQKRNFYSTSWMVLGSAVRMAISLELHLEKPASPKSRSPLDKELQRRLWWTLYTMEADMGLSFGRPNGISGVPADVELPRNIDDSDVAIDGAELPDETDGPSRCSTLICHSRFAADISLPIQDRLMRAPTPAIEEIRAFDLTIQDYVDKLPEYMQGSELDRAPGWFTHAATRLRWRCNNLRMIMFRPFLLSAALAASVARQRGAVRPAQRPAVKQAIALCRQLAKDNVESIAQYWDSHDHNQAASWHAAYFLTQSAFIPLVSILDDPTSPDAGEWLDLLKTCKALLEDMGNITSAALKCRDLIQSVTAGLLDDHIAESRRARDHHAGHPHHLHHQLQHHQHHHAWLQSPADPATIEPMFWAQPYAASASSDGTDLSDVGGPSSLGFSLGSVGSDGMPMFDLHSQIVQTSLEHRPSLAETIDAWTDVRPTTTGSQWSDAGSHSSINAESRQHLQPGNGAGVHQLGANGAGPSTFGRQRHSSSAASMTNSWTYGFHLGDQQGPSDTAAGMPEASLFAHFPTRSLVSSHSQQQQPQPSSSARPMTGDADSHIPSSDGFGDPQWRHAAPAVPPHHHQQHQHHHHHSQQQQHDHPTGDSHDSWWSNLSSFAQDQHPHAPSQGGPHAQHHSGAGTSSNAAAPGGDGNNVASSQAPTAGSSHQHDDHFFDHSAFAGF
ncbi:uncharacterized protein PFL1_01243 [Pseudozyma flocculosa PF-1]|uniref:Related to lactose regulatory protein n=1 Tax=Pseudozyma flocculosa TaxID=84751 RepID=A0A5C3EVL9_9BASI|nr:uncharacterized protein PFL1_01243 [Pseudozyma flocculosa PF-1]EPQ31054.1 hypothetical protein PFL1_01243 [Pseudozyma flocculosa PF-1]SPO35900.1 related to lactose regulatory protein [Pseudozyma flocculosa]